jgi:putative ABC transport system permease protein
MTAVMRAALGGMRGRKLQAAIIGVVLLAATATSVVAFGVLANAHGPFDRAFTAQRGAEVTATVDTSVASRAQLAATARRAGVTAVAGPFPVAVINAKVALPGVTGSSRDTLRLVGRSSPGGPVDDLTLDSGHWPRGAGQIVAERGDGIFTGATITAGSRKLTVTGVADSVTGSADGWVLPPEIAALARQAGTRQPGTGHAGTGQTGTGQAEIMYRFASAGSTAAIAADVAAVRATLPRGALLAPPLSYLTVRGAEQSGIAPWVPFIIAFGVIALVISVLIVVNVVGGAVIAGTTRIGVLKSIGFTPVQVAASYVLLVAIPALAGCAAGAVCGNLLAVPLLSVNAHVYQVGSLSVPLWVDAAVPLAALGLTVAAGLAPALRAGRMSAVQAMATGRAPRAAHGYLAHRMLARLRSVPRPVTLGLAAPFARPARTLVTAAAILFGAAAVTFGAGLALSLDGLVSHRPEAALPVQVTSGQAASAPGGTGTMTATQRRAVVSALAAQPGTLRYVTQASTQVSVAGPAGSASATAFSGNPRWTGYDLITGRWYATRGTGEADVNTMFLTDTGMSVGSHYTLVSGGHRVTVRIVGEVFEPGNNPQVYLSPATLAALDPGIERQQYLVALRPGTSAQAYANAVSAALGHSYLVNVSQQNGQFLAVTTLVAMLTILIMVVAGLGVLNTVALQIRERAHDIGVFKAVGMTPRQTLTMIVCSVACTGLVAGIVAVPAGVYLHHGVIPVMAHAANSGYPASLISVYAPWQLAALGLAGLIIAVAGALGPAGWAARARTVSALRAE